MNEAVAHSAGIPLRIIAVVLAAGRASRMGADSGHKLLAKFDGVPLVRNSVETALASKADRVLAVTGYRASDIEAALYGLDCHIVRNPDYELGMSSSLTLGLATVESEADGLLVMLADMPGIRPDHLDAMISAFHRGQGKVIIRAVADGRWGNPVILPASTFEAISRLTGDVGARRRVPPDRGGGRIREDIAERPQT